MYTKDNKEDPKSQVVPAAVPAHTHTWHVPHVTPMCASTQQANVTASQISSTHTLTQSNVASLGPNVRAP